MLQRPRLARVLPYTCPFFGVAPQASFDDINKFLEANKLSIVAGPIAGGLYKVRVANSALPKDELGAIAKKLGQDKVVGFIVTAQ